MTLNYNDPSAIRRALRHLARGKRLPWPQLACLLDSIDKSNYWANSAKSFTEWLKQNAESIGLKESTLWRYLVVGRYYRDLRRQFARVKLGYPPLEELPSHVSPEKLEILAKLARVAPKDVYEPIVDLVLKNKISREELRAKWRAFRPVLGGKTARGRGVLPPRINRRDQDQYHSLREAMMINAITSHGPGWLGDDRPVMYDVKMHVRPDYQGSNKYRFRYEFDAVALVKRKDAQLEIHGIEISGGLFTRIQRLVEMAEHCDYFWVALHRQGQNIICNPKIRLPDYIGVISVDDGEIYVVHRAEPCKKDPTKSIALLKGLLVKESRK